MTARSLVIWGAGGVARTVVDIIRERGEYEIVGFLDDVNPERHGSSFCDAPILGGAEQIDRLHERGVTHFILAVGINAARLRMAPLVRAAGYQLATVIHPQAAVARDAVVGAGTVIRAMAVIESGVTIGENVIVGPGVLVGHGCVLEEGARVAIGTNLGGDVIVARGAWIGAGVTVDARRRIGAGAIAGAGALVLRDIPDRMVAYGVPARVIRRVTPDDVF